MSKPRFPQGNTRRAQPPALTDPVQSNPARRPLIGAPACGRFITSDDTAAGTRTAIHHQMEKTADTQPADPGQN